MADIELPLDAATPNYDVSITIDGVSFIFHMRWSQRAFDSAINGGAGWFMSIHDVADKPIVTGARVVLGALFFRRSRDPRLPAGTFFASDLSGEDREATLTDLGERVKIYFRPLADLPV